MIDNNIGLICSGCADERKRVVAKNIVNILKIMKSIYKTIFVKTKFIEDKWVEHMWVEIPTRNINMRAKTLKGLLNNDPAYITLIKCGDEVKLNFSDIEDIMEGRK
jgi:uncharacterized protein YegJ (DUF2314 family)